MFSSIHSQFPLIASWKPLLREILAKFSSLFIPCPPSYENTCNYFGSLPQLRFGPFLLLLYFSFIHCCVLFMYLFSPISSSLWLRDWIYFLILFHWLNKLYPYFTHSLIFISQLAFQPIVCHLFWWPLPFIS